MPRVDENAAIQNLFAASPESLKLTPLIFTQHLSVTMRFRGIGARHSCRFTEDFVTATEYKAALQLVNAVP